MTAEKLEKEQWEKVERKGLGISGFSRMFSLLPPSPPPTPFIFFCLYLPFLSVFIPPVCVTVILWVVRGVNVLYRKANCFVWMSISPFLFLPGKANQVCARLFHTRSDQHVL